MAKGKTHAKEVHDRAGKKVRGSERQNQHSCIQIQQESKPDTRISGKVYGKAFRIRLRGFSELRVRMMKMTSAQLTPQRGSILNIHLRQKVSSFDFRTFILFL